ncbi:MAG: APC family permease [Calditrichaeota bacterium]|nr:APC family permease [Calditrichota bacterium]
MASANKTTGLKRHLGLTSLAATGICSMLGAGINVIPFMIQRSVPGIGPMVLPAFMLAALPAVLAGLAYAILASAMPRAGGSYIYASRSLHPYLGFLASFAQWFGLSIAIGVVSYVIVPFVRDVAVALSWQKMAELLETGSIRLTLSLAVLWLFVGINLRGGKLYERTLIPLMILMFAMGAVVIFAGFGYDQGDFATALMSREGRAVPSAPVEGFSLKTLLSGAAVLFASFIGFDSIAQAGGEAKNPARNLPLAIAIAIGGVGAFYLLFTGAVYHAVPWQFIAAEARHSDLTAPGLLGYVLSPGWTVIIIAGAAIALINDLPAMLLAVSRLMFAWAEDGIFPAAVARVHPRWHTPHVAILASGGMATAGVLGCHFAGDFFLGVDLLVTSMLFNFGVMCLSLLTLKRTNPALAERIQVLKSPRIHRPLAGLGVLSLGAFLIIHIGKDLAADLAAWYFHSTWLWLLVMLLASLIFFVEYRRLLRSGANTNRIFSTLPPE